MMTNAEKRDKISIICKNHSCHRGCPLALENTNLGVVMFDCNVLMHMSAKDYEGLKELVDKVFEEGDYEY